MVKRVKKLHLLTERFRGNKAVKTGVFSDRKYVDGMSVAQTAFWGEYGTKTAPPRPFFRNAINANKDKWRDTLVKALKNTNYDTAKALALLGEQMMGDIQDEIISGSFAANSPVTLLLKDRFPKNPEDITIDDFLQAIDDTAKGISAGGGNNKPLVWTGTLSRSITYKVDDES